MVGISALPLGGGGRGTGRAREAMLWHCLKRSDYVTAHIIIILTYCKTEGLIRSDIYRNYTRTAQAWVGEPELGYLISVTHIVTVLYY